VLSDPSNTPDPPAREDEDHKDFIQQGKVLIVQRKFQEAVKVLRLGLLANPMAVEGRLVLGMALMALTKHDEVLGEMRATLEMDPDNAMAYLLKGEALFHKGDFYQAREALLCAQDLDPLNHKAGRLLEEMDQQADPDDPFDPRSGTDTRRYPASRAQQIEVAHHGSDPMVDPSPAPLMDEDPGEHTNVTHAEPDMDDDEDWDVGGGWDDDEVLDADNLWDTDASLELDDLLEEDEEGDEERYLTAPWLPPPTWRNCRKRRQRSGMMRRWWRTRPTPRAPGMSSRRSRTWTAESTSHPR